MHKIQSENPHCQDRQCMISAHKYMLMSWSLVFYSMLCGDWAEGNQADIRQIDGNKVIITDIQPDAFKQMLRYLCFSSLYQIHSNLELQFIS